MTTINTTRIRSLEGRKMDASAIANAMMAESVRARQTFLDKASKSIRFTAESYLADAVAAEQTMRMAADLNAIVEEGFNLADTTQLLTRYIKQMTDRAIAWMPSHSTSTISNLCDEAERKANLDAIVSYKAALKALAE